MPDSDRVGGGSDHLKDAESVLKKLGFSRVAPARRATETPASFWVQESGVPRRTFPVFVQGTATADPASDVDRWVQGASADAAALPHRAIFVVPNDLAADATWARLTHTAGSAIENELAVLVVPGERAGRSGAHFHLRLAEPKEILRLATGVVVGLFRRAAASDEPGQIDFEEMLTLLRQRFGVDVNRSLGVKSDEDALFLLYQLAQRDSYAPGDPGANLHLIVLKPTGPAARLPWFAA